MQESMPMLRHRSSCFLLGGLQLSSFWRAKLSCGKDTPRFFTECSPWDDEQEAMKTFKNLSYVCLNMYIHAPNWCISRHWYACYQKEIIPPTVKCHFKKFVEASNFKTNNVKVWLNRYSWGAGKLRSEYTSWFRRLECTLWKISYANLCANQTKNGGRRLPVVKHECYAKSSVITYLKLILDGES